MIKHLITYSIFHTAFSVKNAFAVSYDTDTKLAERIYDMPLSERDMIMVGAFMMIVIIGLGGFAFFKNLSAKSLLALLMITVFISMIALIFLFGSAYGLSPVYGTLTLGVLLILFKLMNQFEINRK